MSRQLDLFGVENGIDGQTRVNVTVTTKTVREEVELALGLIEAETWTARHKFHKYWGKKPANVVDRYIQHFTEVGEVVCDPFCGSGVTAVEAAISNRHFVGFDINPFAVRHTSALLCPPNLKTFTSAANSILASVSKKAAELYSTQCTKCGRYAEVKSYLYKTDCLLEVRYHCSSCGSLIKEPDAIDHELSKVKHCAPSGTPDAEVFYGWQMRKLKRRSIKRWSELFTSRNYYISGLIWSEIMEVTDRVTRDWLLLTFTAGLAQFTKMIADFKGAGGGPSWKLNSYWLPERWQELNPMQYFENRVRRSIAAIKELERCGSPFNVKASIYEADSRKLSLDDESIDYIFTDPPYGGEGIQYGELSMLWCLWLGEEQKLDREIAFNPVRNLSEQDYADGLKCSFSEAFRVLKPGKAMTVTFANKDPKIWDALMDACRSAGFRLITAVPMKRSAPSLTETTMEQAPKADLILTFEKPRSPVELSVAFDDKEYDLERRVVALGKMLVSTDQSCDVDRLYDMITIDWFSWYYENGVRPNSVRPTLREVKRILDEKPV